VHLLTSFLICIVLLVTLSGDIVSGRVLRAEVRERWYPSGAEAFIRQENLQGNIFNLYSWGGHLIWTLGPQRKTFVDGRNTNETAFVHYSAILRAETGADVLHPLWKRLLDAYGVNVVLVSAVSTAGMIHPLVDRLYAAPEWELVFADGKALLFLRDTPGNRTIIAARRISKDAILDEVIAECETGIRETPATWGYYEVLGYAYYKKNRPADALRMFNKYLSMNPYNQNVRGFRDVLQQYAAPTPP
jgi:tetratricopeptide (TPR) repeat protein